MRGMTTQHQRSFGAPLPRTIAGPGVAGGRPVGPIASVFQGVHWSLALVAFGAYVYTITSYKIHIGTEAMVVALLTLPLERTGLRLSTPMAWMIAFVAWAALGLTLTS